MKKYKIVCVDDEKVMLELYKIYLEKLDYEIVVHESCKSALEYLKTNIDEVIYVFSDFLMPEMDGIEFRKKMIDLDLDIPFSMVTGYYDLEMAKKGMAYRISSFVSKPFVEKDLIDLINDLGEKRKIILMKNVK